MSAGPMPICVFAKPPRAGVAKTRLGATIGAAPAAALAAAFLEDTWNMVRSLPWARPILATTDEAATDETWLVACWESGRPEIWLQGEGDLGERLERVLGRALEVGPGAIAIGTDSPGLPPSLLGQARSALEEGVAVLGPADDGGYYLLGLPRCRRGLLADIPWSTPEVCGRTIERLCRAGLEVRLLDRWFDVDHAADLARLRGLIAAGEIEAPATAAALAALP